MLSQRSICWAEITIISLFFQSLLFPAIGRSLGLDSEGTADPECLYECNLIEVTLDKKITNQTNYKIHMKCAYKAYGDIACPAYATTYVGKGWWDDKIKWAFEEIQLSSIYHINTISRCESNPWLGSLVSCATIQRDIVVGNYPPLPDYTPVTALLMSDDNKDALKQQESSIAPSLQAPYFLEPFDNTTFNASDSIPIKVQHLKGYLLKFEIQHRSSSSQPFSLLEPVHLNVNTQPVPTGNNDYVITTTHYKPIAGGEFRIRAKCSAYWEYPAEWSGWTGFTVKVPSSPKIIFPATDGQRFKISDDILIETEHDANYPVSFSFKRKAFTSGAIPAGTYPVEPLAKDCSSAVRDGIASISCSYKFKKSGIYTVSAQYHGLTVPASIRKFEIVLASKNIELKPSGNFSITPPEITKPSENFKTKMGSPVDVAISYNPAFGPVEVITYKGFGTMINMYREKITSIFPETLHYKYFFSEPGHMFVQVKYKNHPKSKSTRSIIITDETDPNAIQILSPHHLDQFTLSELILLSAKVNWPMAKYKYYWRPIPKEGEWPVSWKEFHPHNHSAPLVFTDSTYLLGGFTQKKYLACRKVGRYKIEIGISKKMKPDTVEFEVTGPTPGLKILYPSPGKQFHLSDQILIEVESSRNCPVEYSFRRVPFQSGNTTVASLPVEPLTKECSGAITKDNLESSSCNYTFKETGKYIFSAKYVNGEGTAPSIRTFDITPNSYQINQKPNLTSTHPEEQLRIQPTSLPNNNLSPADTMPPIIFDRKKMRFIRFDTVALTLLNTGQQELDFDFQYNEKNHLFQHVSKAPAAIIKYGKHKTIATFKNLQPGKWRVRAKRASNESRWSGWYAFSVVAPKERITISKPGRISSASTINSSLNPVQKMPEILAPRRNSITKTTDSVFVSIRHHKKTKPIIVFQYRKKPGKGAYAPEPVNVSRFKTINGKTTGTLIFNKAGEYRFRVKEREPGAKWSKWREFKIKNDIKVDKPRRIFPPSTTNNTLNLAQKAPEILLPKKNSISKTISRVFFTVSHSKNIKVSFAFQYRKKPGKGAYASEPVNVSRFKTSKGKTTGALIFKKAGEYRFRVKERRPGAKWSKWREFKIKSDIIINKPRRIFPQSITNNNRIQKAPKRNAPKNK